MRDSHRSLLYRAEDLVGRIWDRDDEGSVTVDFHGSSLTLPIQRRFGDIAGVQRFCDATLVGLAVPPVVVRRRAGQSRATWTSPNLIAVPDASWALREMPVVHELAHHVAAHTGCGDPAHGPGFAAVYLDLLERVSGPEVALLLRATLDQVGFPHSTDRRPA